MGSLYLVRHGQASFGTDDYDRLSDIGARQCTALGRWFAARGRRFDAVLTGTLKRHAQSLEAIAAALPGLPEPRSLAGLDEYDSQALVQALAREAGGAPPAWSAEGDRRGHFRLLREALHRWMAGTLEVPGMRRWGEFRRGVVEVLDEVRASGAAEVLLVSSGGPISTAIAHVLDAPAESVVALNLQMRNSAVNEFTFTPSRHWLVGYNALPHLDHPDHAGWVTLS